MEAVVKVAVTDKPASPSIAVPYNVFAIGGSSGVPQLQTLMTTDGSLKLSHVPVVVTNVIKAV